MLIVPEAWNTWPASVVVGESVTSVNVKSPSTRSPDGKSSSLHPATPSYGQDRRDQHYNQPDDRPSFEPSLAPACPPVTAIVGCSAATPHCQLGLAPWSGRDALTRARDPDEQLRWALAEAVVWPALALESDKDDHRTTDPRQPTAPIVASDVRSRLDQGSI